MKESGFLAVEHRQEKVYDFNGDEQKTNKQKMKERNL